jgi:hypothetical protein
VNQRTTSPLHAVARDPSRPASLRLTTSLPHPHYRTPPPPSCCPCHRHASPRRASSPTRCPCRPWPHHDYGSVQATICMLRIRLRSSATHDPVPTHITERCPHLASGRCAGRHPSPSWTPATPPWPPSAPSFPRTVPVPRFPPAASQGSAMTEWFIRPPPPPRLHLCRQPYRAPMPSAAKTMEVDVVPLGRGRWLAK